MFDYKDVSLNVGIVTLDGESMAVAQFRDEIVYHYRAALVQGTCENNKILDLLIDYLEKLENEIT